MSTLDELDRLDRQINNAKTDRDIANGQRATLLSQLEKTFSVKSLEGAKRKASKLEGDVADTKELLEEKYKDLTENYAW